MLQGNILQEVRNLRFLVSEEGVVTGVSFLLDNGDLQIWTKGDGDFMSACSLSRLWVNQKRTLSGSSN